MERMLARISKSTITLLRFLALANNGHSWGGEDHCRRKLPVEGRTCEMNHLLMCQNMPGLSAG